MRGESAGLKRKDNTYRSISTFRNTTASRLKYLFSRSCCDIPRFFLAPTSTPSPSPAPAEDTDARLVMDVWGWCLDLEFGLGVGDIFLFFWVE
jgi:hypothetical protein